VLDVRRPRRVVDDAERIRAGAVVALPGGVGSPAPAVPRAGHGPRPSLAARLRTDRGRRRRRDPGWLPDG
jgi:hypothetical protein